MATETTTTIELERLRHSQPPSSDNQSDLIETPTVDANTGFSLPPADGGKDAWLVLLCCFMLEALIWGFPASFGVFQEYYSTHEFAGSGNIAVIGACALGMMYMDVVVMFSLLKYFPKLRAWATPIGLVIGSLALGLGSLSTKVSHLIMTQGVLYAIGGGFAWAPILFYLEEWWVRRRGFAYGVTVAGLGLSGAILPIVLEWLLHSYGFRTTLRVCALSFIVLNFPLLYFFKPRIPLSQTFQSKKFDMTFWTSSKFLIYQSANIISGLGYFLPATYLPTFARSLGASEMESIVTVCLTNFAAFFGCLIMGSAVDKYNVSTCLLISATGSALGVFLIWGLSTSLPVLYVFCLVYGAFAGCASSSWSAIIRETKDGRRGADSGMIFACLSAGKGVGNLASGPLSEALLHARRFNAGMAYGGPYGVLIVFTGITSVLGGWSYIARRVGWV